MNFLRTLFTHRRDFKNTLRKNELERVNQELRILDHELTKTMKFFKKSPRMPLYMVMGYTSFGKTTLLSKSGIKVVDVLGDSVSPLPTKYFSWFFSDNAIYLDTAGSYAQTDKDSPHFSLVWVGFLKLLKKYFNKLVSGMIVVIDIPTLSGDREKLRKVLSDLRERVYEVAKYTQHLPVYVVFTKADLIPGFLNFFGSISDDERKEPLGFVLKSSRDIAESKVKKLNTKLDSLLEVLYDRSIQKLYQEKNREKHFGIVNFPFQMESLRTNILEVAKILPDGGSIDLAGMYFTSSIQVGVPVDILERTFLKDFNLKSISQEDDSYDELLPSAKRTYFVEDLFKKIIRTSEAVIVKTAAASSNANKLISILSISLILMLSFFAGDYARNNVADTIVSVQGELNDYAATHDANKILALISDLEEKDHFWWTSIGFNQVSKMNLALKKVYFSSVSQVFLLGLQKNIEDAVNNAKSASNPESLYRALKVYLMLTGKEKIDVIYVQRWFDSYWAQFFKNYPTKLNSLKADLAIGLEQGFKIEDDPVFLADARNALLNLCLPKVDSVYLLLEENYKNQDLAISFPGNKITISKMYTAENFDKIFNKEIVKTIDSLMVKNKKFILDKDSRSQIDFDHKKLIDDVRSEYLQHYAVAWMSALKAVDFTVSGNLTTDVISAKHFLEDILNNKFPMLLLLKAAQDNTVIQGGPTLFAKIVTAKFADIDALDLKAVIAELSRLTSYFNYITSSSDVNKYAFTAALERYQNTRPDNDVIGNFHQFALKQPYPLQGWLETIADNSWKAILQSTQDYINSIWSLSVLPEFQKNIAGNYPLVKDTLNSISIPNFTRFFGPKGTMNTFFNYYIKPFVDTSQVYWVWKDVDGQHLNIAQNNLELFIKAELIQKMFIFGNNDLTSSFVMEPVEMSPNTQFFMLNLSNHFVSYRSGPRKADHIFWSAQNNQSISIEFVSTQGKHEISSISADPWALLRIFDKANIHPAGTPGHFELTFDLNGNSIMYQIISDQPVNPFVPEIMTNFQCPSKL